MNRAAPLFESLLDAKRGEERIASALGKAIATDCFSPKVARKLQTALLRTREAVAEFPPAIRAIERGIVVILAGRRRTN